MRKMIYRTLNLIGWCIGRIWFDVLRIRRKIILDNLRLAFPDWTETERLKVARASMVSLGQSITDFFVFPFFNQSNLDEYFVFGGLDHLDRALSQGRGALILGLHLGSGDFAIAACSRRGYKMNLISKLFRSAWLNQLWFSLRGRHGTQFISPEKSTFEILRALKRNEAVIFVLDQFMGPPVGVRTRFFGVETGTAAGLALIAARTRAPVLPSYTYRLSDGRHQIVFEAPLDVQAVSPDESLSKENIARMTQAYTDKLEAIIRAHPTQWMWIHRRWKEFRET